MTALNMTEDFIKTYFGNQKTLSVSQFLEILNQGLGSYAVTVTGEVTSFQRRGNALYFSLKDERDNAVMSCFMWQRDLQSCGVTIEDGQSILIYGVPQVYKPTGRLTFQVKMVQMVGEGALKKAYLELKTKLEKEGMFALDRKKKIPERVKRIGLITSKTGAVIHDFLNNLGKYGFEINLYDVHVEGIYALKDITSAFSHFKKSNVDVVVLIRGGGSLESFAAFNNEVLVRMIAEFPIPVIAGLGHDQDVPLVSLVADAMTSTPTAITALLNEPWQHTIHELQLIQSSLVQFMRSTIYKHEYTVKSVEQRLMKGLYAQKEKIDLVFTNFIQLTKKVGFRINRLQDWFGYVEKQLEARDPQRLLSKGYAFIRNKSRQGDKLTGGLVKKVGQLKSGDEIELTLSDGTKDAYIA